MKIFFLCLVFLSSCRTQQDDSNLDARRRPGDYVANRLNCEYERKPDTESSRVDFVVKGFRVNMIRNYSDNSTKLDIIGREYYQEIKNDKIHWDYEESELDRVAGGTLFLDINGRNITRIYQKDNDDSFYVEKKYFTSESSYTEIKDVSCILEKETEHDNAFLNKLRSSTDFHTFTLWTPQRRGMRNLYKKIIYLKSDNLKKSYILDGNSFLDEGDEEGDMGSRWSYFIYYYYQGPLNPTKEKFSFDMVRNELKVGNISSTEFKKNVISFKD